MHFENVNRMSFVTVARQWGHLYEKNNPRLTQAAN